MNSNLFCGSRRFFEIEGTSIVPALDLALRPTGALLDRLTHHVHILEMNGDSFRLAQVIDRMGVEQLLTNLYLPM